MPFQSVSPEARNPSHDIHKNSSSYDDFTSSDDDLVTPVSQANMSSTPTEHAASGPSTPQKAHGILEGVGPELQPGSTRRPRSNVTYNIKQLSHQTRAPSEPDLKKSTPQDPRPEPKSSHHASAQAIRKDQKQKKQKRQPGPKPNSRRTKNRLKKYKKAQERARASKRASGVDDDNVADGPPAKRRRVEEESTVLSKVETPAQQFAQTEGTPKNAAISKQIDYIFQTLRDAVEPKPGEVRESIASNPLNHKLLTLPKQRDIEWKTGRANDWKLNKSIDATAFLMQMTGRMARTPCTRCVNGLGQWVNCILMPTGADYEKIYGCANCVYHGRQTYCSYKFWGRHGPRKTAPGQVQEHTEGIEDFHQDRPPIPAAERVTGQGEIATNNNADLSGSKQALLHQVDERRRSTRSSVANSREVTEVEEILTSLVTVGRPGGLLSMEPWERAPGRIRSHIPDKAESKLPCPLVEGY